MALRIKASASKVLAIDWDARSVRMVLVRTRRDALEVVKAASMPVPPDVRVDDAPAFGDFLRKCLSQTGIGGKSAVVGIPRERVVLNTLSVPPTPDDDLPALVLFQITKELPFGPDEATLDFATRAGDSRSPRDVLVAAVRNDVLSYYEQVASAADLRLERVGLRPYANLMAVLPAAAAENANTLLLVDIGPELTEIDIVSGGRLVFSRAASVQIPPESTESSGRMDDSRIFANPLVDRASADPTTQSAVDDLLLEVSRSIEAFRATAAGAKIDRVIVAGATGVESAFATVISDRVGAAAELFDPGRTLDLSPARARQLRGFSAALGLAMSVGRVGVEQIDFLEPKKPVTRRARQIKKLPIGIAAAASVVVALVAARQAALGQLSKDVAALQKRVDSYASVDKASTELKPQMSSLDKWVDQARPWIDDLVRLSRALPGNRDLYATGVQMIANQSRINFTLRTKSSTLATDLVERLNDMGSYDTRFDRQSQQRMADGFEFTTPITITIKSAPAALGVKRSAAATAPAASAPASRASNEHPPGHTPAPAADHAGKIAGPVGRKPAARTEQHDKSAPRRNGGRS